MQTTWPGLSKACIAMLKFMQVQESPLTSTTMQNL